MSSKCKGVRKRSDGLWLAQISVKPFKRISKTFSDQKAAADWAEQQRDFLREQREQGTVRADIGKLTFSDVAAEYLKDPDISSKKYFDELHRNLCWWTNLYGRVKAREFFGVTHIRDGRDRLRRQHEPGTCNRYLSAARSCLNWARATKFIPLDCLWPPRCMFREPKHRERFLSDDELKRLLAEAKKHSPQMHAAVAVAIASGCRQGELLRLTWGDVDLKAHQVAFKITKIDEPRRVHLLKSACDALAALKDDKVTPLPSRPIFVNAEGEQWHNYELLNRWKHLRKAAQLEGLRWHDLRHSTASILVQNGASLPEIGMKLGHKSTLTTSRYAHLLAGKPVTGDDKLDEKLRG